MLRLLAPLTTHYTVVCFSVKPLHWNTRATAFTVFQHPGCPAEGMPFLLIIFSLLFQSFK